jgi:hypothetical protein
MAWRRSESQRGVERIYVLILFSITSSFFVLIGEFTDLSQTTMPQD